MNTELKLEVGKSYRTRGGWKATVVWMEESRILVSLGGRGYGARRFRTWKLDASTATLGIFTLPKSQIGPATSASRWC